MGGKNYYVSGSNNITCDVCSKKIKASDAKHRWDGFIVCPDDFEQRHPQDFVKARQDKITIPFSRPRPPDVFVDDGNRYLTDTLTLTELMAITSNKLFNDSLLIDDAGSDYIDISYFLEDYIISIGLYIAVSKTEQETVTLTESGFVFINSYVDATYFAEDYVGTVTPF